MADDIFGQYPTFKWEVGGKAILFAAVEIRERGGNRIARHKRYGRKGARCDDTGAQEKEWRLRAFIFNDPEQEPGIDGAAQYPDVAIALTDSFDIHETGTLTTPTRGPRRCRAESYERVEVEKERDACALELVFVEDNEDDADVAAFQAPSAQSILKTLAVETFAACTDVGAFNTDVGSLTELAGDIVGLIEAPGQFVADMEAKNNAFLNQLESIEKAFSNETEKANEKVQTLLTDPEGSLGVRRLRELHDAAARAPLEKAVLGSPVARPTIAMAFTKRLSLWDIASALGQNGDDLVPLNPGLPDLLDIPPNTPVTVFDAKRGAADAA